MSVDIVFFDIHAHDGQCACRTTRKHVAIVGGAFDGCEACFKPNGYPSVGRVYNIGTHVRYVTETRASGVVLRDVTPRGWLL